MKRVILIVVFSFSLFTGLGLSHAVDIEGVRVEDQITLSGGAQLILNGTGVRQQLTFPKQYVGALYLAKKQKDPTEIFKDGGAMRIAMFVLADEIKVAQLVASMNNSLAVNHVPAELAPIESRLQDLNRMMLAVGVLKKGAVVTISYQPATGTHISINSEEKLVIKGEDFFKALLRIWIGRKPVDGRLRDALLGGAGNFTLF